MESEKLMISDIERAGIVKTLLRGVGQVMFQSNAWCGLLFLAGIFWGAYSTGEPAVAWGALSGVMVATLTGYILNLDQEEGSEGLWGFNGVLVGCAFPTFMSNTIWMWLALALAAAMTTWVRTAMNNVMAQWRINSLTFPFVLTTWIFLFAARAMPELLPEHIAATHIVESGFAAAVTSWLRGISQIFLIDSWITGAIFLVGLFIADRRAMLWAMVGSAVAMVVAWAFGASAADISSGLYGFSPALTAIALATVFYRPSFRSGAWALTGIIVTTFIQAAMNTATTPYAIATLTAPFCVATWLFLLPRLTLDRHESPDHSSWHRQRYNKQ